MRSVLLQCAAALAVLLCLCPDHVRAADHIQVHSLLPPILRNYWANGMQFWAFGRRTVITDNYVQLTNLDERSHGYLWNRRENHLESFQLNVTVQMRSRDGAWFAPGGDSGFGVWYANDPKVNYQTDDTFFGFKQKFRGIGVVLDHSNELHLLESDGSYALNPTSMKTHEKGSCSVGSVGEMHLTISIVYAAQTLQLFYTTHPGTEPQPADYLNAVLCATVSPLALSSSYHFGVTAANSANGQAVHTIHSVIMSPLSGSSLLQREADTIAQVHLFENQQQPEAAVEDGAQVTQTSLPPVSVVPHSTEEPSSPPPQVTESVPPQQPQQNEMVPAGANNEEAANTEPVQTASVSPPGLADEF